MVRTQIQLTEEQVRLLRDMSRSRRESMASLIRRAVDQFLTNRKPDRTSLYRQALGVVGKYEAGVSDISLRHDRYLAEVFGE